MAEAWGSDAPSALGYYAALTGRMLLGSGVIQVGTRTPVAVAQTAITLSNLSGGRFLLGLGASGPQVLEGLHGVPFARPLTRVRETLEIVRRVLDGGSGKLSYSGRGGTMKYMLLVCGDDTADASGMAPVEPWVEELGARASRPPSPSTARRAPASTRATGSSCR